MAADKSDTDGRHIPFISFVPFLLIAFGIAWGILASYVFFPEQMTGLFGELTGLHPLFFLAVYSPAIAAFSVIIYHTGLKGFRSYLSRFLLWRCSLSWYIFMIIGIPVVFIVGSAIKGNLCEDLYSFSSIRSLLTALLLTALKGPIEEFGWRGLALPLLQRKIAPIWAGLVLGIIWGFWHMPAFLLSGTPQGNWSFMPFFLGSVALSVIVTPLFNTSRGSILLPALFHFFINNPIWPDAQPYDICLFVLVAVLVVWFNRKNVFTRENAVTEVVPIVQGTGNPKISDGTR